MKRVDLSPELIAKTEKALAEIEEGVFGEERALPTKSGVRAGAGCKPGSCPVPLYGTPV